MRGDAYKGKRWNALASVMRKYGNNIINLNYWFYLWVLWQLKLQTSCTVPLSERGEKYLGHKKEKKQKKLIVLEKIQFVGAATCSNPSRIYRWRTQLYSWHSDHGIWMFHILKHWRCIKLETSIHKQNIMSQYKWSVERTVLCIQTKIVNLWQENKKINNK